MYLVDRPGHGRSPVSLDALGPIGTLPMHAGIAADTMRAATGTPKRWPGTTGAIGDPLLDRIGPAIIQTHSMMYLTAENSGRTNGPAARQTARG